MTSLPATLTMGAVSLSVGDLQRSLHYYKQHIGLSVLKQQGNTATLGVGSRELLHLEGITGAKHFSGTSGLYHFALRVPSRVHLAHFIMRLLQNQSRIDGASNHLVSEALYLTDPDGHGIEVYSDRPRSEWPKANGTVRMDTLPLDSEDVLKELPQGTNPERLADGTDMGHVHLHVADTHAAEAFYVGILGFDKIMTISRALFVSAGGYHHHLGLITWAGIGAKQAPAHAARLLRYEIVLPDQGALDAVNDRLYVAKIAMQEKNDVVIVDDPSGNTINLRLA